MALIEERPLGAVELGALEARGVSVPAYDLGDVVVGHVHVGPGVFHRGHQAAYAERALANGHRHAAICAISMHSPDVRTALEAQDHLYTCVERDADGSRAAIVGAIRQVLVAKDDPAAAVERLTDPSVTVVTTTVTEAGYCCKPGARSLDRAHPGVRHDLHEPRLPSTMPGLLVAALARRREHHLAPFAVVPCDNLTANGELARGVLVGLAASTDPDLARWIESSVPFCSTMVDRMVPSITDDTRRTSTSLTGLLDALPVATEPFSQWVIERHPAVDLRAWVSAGAEIVDDVTRHERLKLRVLNGTHSALAYLGLRAGHHTVDDALADHRVSSFVRAMLLDEILPTVDAPAGVDSQRYADTVLARFTNRSLRYATSKVATDGSLKLAERLLPVALDRLSHGSGIDGIATVIAAWMWCVVGPAAADLGVGDPLAPELVRAVGDHFDDPELIVDLLLVDLGVFGPEGRRGQLVEAVRRRALSVWSDEARGTS